LAEVEANDRVPNQLLADKDPDDPTNDAGTGKGKGKVEGEVDEANVAGNIPGPMLPLGASADSKRKKKSSRWK
jgi:hypothetical protein